MTTLHVVQRTLDDMTQFFKFGTGQSSGSFSGMILRLPDPEPGHRIRLSVKLSNPAFLESLAAKMATGRATFRVQDRIGETRDVTVSRVLGVNTFQVAEGQSVVVAPVENDNGETQEMVPFITSALGLLVLDHFTDLLDGTVSGSAEAEDGGTKITIKIELPGPKTPKDEDEEGDDPKDEDPEDEEGDDPKDEDPEDAGGEGGEGKGGDGQPNGGGADGP